MTSRRAALSGNTLLIATFLLYNSVNCFFSQYCAMHNMSIYIQSGPKSENTQRFVQAKPSIA